MMLQAARNLDGARVACAEKGYQIRHPKFYGVNGYLHAAHHQLIHAKRQTSDEIFQARGHIEGYAILDISILSAKDLRFAERFSRTLKYTPTT